VGKQTGCFIIFSTVDIKAVNISLWPEQGNGLIHKSCQI